MTTAQAILLGVMMAFTPSLIVFTILIYRAPLVEGDLQQSSEVSGSPS